jgi:hypothetical protein
MDRALARGALARCVMWGGNKLVLKNALWAKNKKPRVGLCVAFFSAFLQWFIL